MVGDPRRFGYFTFNDDVALAAATADPVGFVDDLPDRSILDEVQRVPELFTSLKRAVDRRRTPSRFPLTGSANVLLVPKLSESLAGRMEILRLHPFSQSEIAGRAPRFLDALFAGALKARSVERLRGALIEQVAAGGFPAARSRARHRGGARPGTATTSRRSSSATYGTWRASVPWMCSHACLRSLPARPGDC
jgi:predicted AAA+ superfamily ATPase